MQDCVSAPPQPSRPEAPARDPSQAAAARLVVIDALRGLSLSFMALEHCSVIAHVNTLAEHYEGRVPRLWHWPFFTAGLITNMAGPTFWLVAGVSIALFESARRRRGATERDITRFFLIRAAALVLLDLTAIALLTGWSRGKPYDYEVDVLSSMGIMLAILSVARRLPDRVILLASLALLGGYQALLGWIRPHLPAPEHGRFLLSIWVEFTTTIEPPVWFPILGWGGLMGLGLYLGRRLHSPLAQRPGTWLAAAAGLFAAWLAIRSIGGYGCFAPYDLSTEWRYFLVMSKGPPSLDFFTFNLGLASLALAAFWARPDLLGRAPLKWLVSCGQASLCFYIAHEAVYPAIGALGFPPESLGGGVRYPLVYVLGMAVLIPLTTAYRKLKKRHPESFLQYL